MSHSRVSSFTNLAFDTPLGLAGCLGLEKSQKVLFEKVLRSPHHMARARLFSDSFRKAFQPEFGASRGLARVLKSLSNPQNCRKKEKILETGTFIFCAKPWYAPNPGSKNIYSSAL